MRDVIPKPAWFFVALLVTAIYGCARFEAGISHGKGSRIVRNVIRVKAPYAPTGEDKVPYSLLTFQAGDPQERFPILYALHSGGLDGRDYLEFWRREAEQRRVMVLAPTRPQGYRNEGVEVQIFDQLLEEVARRYPVNRDRVFVVGTSSGALAARWILANRASAVRAAIFVAGPSFPRWAKEVDTRRFPPLLFVEGEKDPQFESGEVLNDVKILRSRGVPVTLSSDPEAGHEHRAEWNGKIFEWLQT